MDFENKNYQMLELNKIIDKIIEYVDLDKSIDILEHIQAIDDIDVINRVLDEVNEALVLVNRMGKYSTYFKVDISYHLSKIHKNGSINALELSQIACFLDTIRDVFLYFDRLEDNKIESIYLKNRLNNLFYPKELNLKIRNIVTPYGEIKDDASSILKSIRKSIRDSEKSVQSKIQEIAQKNSSKLTQNVISMRNDRYVLPVKSDYKNQIKGIIHDESASGETVYIEPIVICELNNKISRLYEDEKREIENILRNISFEIDEYYNVISLAYDELVYLDICFAKAKYAKSINAFRPHINQDGILELYDCYHPLLNVSNIVKNDVSLGKDYQGIIITGPNTGGKTVLLKTLGLLSLMVKFGILIPASEKSNVMIFDNVYSDIGDEQSINQNLSTFSSHMTNVINIINNVNENSLVLLDELGSGTDPVEGSSLAIAIFDYLISKKCLLVSTSHYSELKIHAYNSNNIINASVEFDDKTLKPTYKLLIGVPGMSNAINISENLGLKTEILHNARNYVYKKNDNLNLVLDKMIKQSHLLDEIIKEVEKEKEELDNKIKEQERILKENLDIRNEIIIKANEEKEKIINKTKKELEDILDELESLKSKSVKGHEIADIKHKIRELDKDELEEINEEVKEEISVGLRVFINSYNTNGIVTKILKNDMFEVNAGIMTLKVKKDDLKIIKQDNNVKQYDVRNKQERNINLKKSVSAKLDLRGLRYEEAKDMIEKYLDDAIYASLQSVTIIHGFGTGTIRKLVHMILKSNPNVLEYRYGGEKEGGLGATVVTFKS